MLVLKTFHAMAFLCLQYSKWFFTKDDDVRGSRLAQWVAHTTPDLRVLSSNSTWGVGEESFLKNDVDFGVSVSTVCDQERKALVWHW